MGAKQLYDITPLAGQFLAGRRRVQGATTIALTAEEAEFELSAGTIVPHGQPFPNVDPPPALIATDVISFTRNGLTQELSYAEFLVRMRLDLGVVPTTPIDVTGPIILTASTLTVPEGVAFSVLLTANETVTWTKTGGADASLFTLTGSNGALSLAAMDFEAPSDANGDNAYVVQVTATDAAGNATSLVLTVTITNVVELPIIVPGALDFALAAGSGLIAALAA